MLPIETELYLFQTRTLSRQKIAKELIGDFRSPIYVTDRYSAYDLLPDKNHQRCWAHLKRDFQKISEHSDVPRTRGKKLLKAYRSFFETPNVPPKNHHAERQLRSLVISKRLTFRTQSERGSRFVERIFSVVATCKQQKKCLGIYYGCSSELVWNSSKPRRPFTSDMNDYHKQDLRKTHYPIRHS